MRRKDEMRGGRGEGEEEKERRREEGEKRIEKRYILLHLQHKCTMKKGDELL
jgi:hypothetical protein